MIVFRAIVGLDISFEALLLWFSLSSEECLGIIFWLGLNFMAWTFKVSPLLIGIYQ